MAAPCLCLLAAQAAGFLWCSAGCVDTTPPWEKVKAAGGSGGLGAAGGATGQALDGPVGAGGAREAGVGGAIDWGGGGAGAAIGGADGAIDALWTGALGEIDTGRGGAGGLGFGGSSIDVPIVGTGGAAGDSDGGPDVPVGGGGGATVEGGAPGEDGAPTTGGTAGTDGASVAGGTTGSGGTFGSGGASITGGRTGTGGAPPTGGTSGTGGANGTGGATTPDAGSDGHPDANPLLTGLLVYYTFESADGTTLPDMSGKGNHGALSIDLLPDGGSPSDPGYEFVPSKPGLGNALSVHKVGLGYVRVPTAVFANATDLTIAVWVNVTTSQSWQRLVDVGIDAHIAQNTGTGTTYLNIVPKGSDSTADNMLFRISRNGYNNEQKLTTPSLSTSTWTHVTLVLASGAGGKLYVNGVEKDSQSSVTLRPVDLGAIDYAFIAKSPFSADPHFDGIVDEFRVYNRALSAAEVLALFNFTGS